MADTIVNAPGRVDTSDTVVGWVIAAVIALALFVGVLALVRNNAPAATTQTTVPTTAVTGGSN